MWLVIEDHDNLFIMAESVHFLGIAILGYKLISKRNAGGELQQHWINMPDGHSLLEEAAAEPIVCWATCSSASRSQAGGDPCRRAGDALTFWLCMLAVRLGACAVHQGCGC